MQDYVLEIKDSPTTNESNVLLEGIIEYNHQHIEKSTRQTFGIFVRNSNEKIIAGLEGLIAWGWLYIKNLWVSEQIRNNGIGRKLLLQAEDQAKACGCSYARLETFDFQARSFYEKSGYIVFAVLDDFPIRHQAFFMRKKL